MNRRITWLVHGLAAAAAVVALGCAGHDAGVGNGSSGSSGSPGSPGSPGTSGSSGTAGTPAAQNEALFQAPTGQATPGSIYGVWGGSKNRDGFTFDTRIRFSKASATVALRCTPDGSGKVSGIVGVTTAARITDESLVFLETKSDQKGDGDARCTVNVTPREVKACAAANKGFEHDCFKVDGTQFVDFGATPFDSLELTKLND